MMRDAVLDATFAIIAGGRSRRLNGVPKALLQFNGRSILEGLLELGSGFAETLLVANDPLPYRSFGIRTVPDLIPNRGAPGGVHAALSHARTPWVLAVGCDMPFITAAVMDAVLTERGEDVDVVAFERDGSMEPLLAIYRARLAPSWGAALSYQPSFRELIQGYRARLLPEVRLRELDPEGRALVSINSPQDVWQWGVTLPGSLGRLP